MEQIAVKLSLERASNAFEATPELSCPSAEAELYSA